MGHNLSLVLLVLGAAAVLLLLRIAFSSGGASSEHSSPTYAPTGGGDGSRLSHAFASPPSPGKNLGSAPIARDLGRVTVMGFNFAHFDAVPGPEDPENFADELILELYDSVSDFRWTTTYVVATPLGIRKLMDEERWSFFYATEIFVVRRYDLETIRQAVYGRVKEVHDRVALDADAPPSAG